MSASQQKKFRKDQQMEGVEQLSPLQMQEVAAKKRRRIIVSSICIILAVLIVVTILFNSNLFYNKVAAVEINDKTYTTAEFNYYYFSSYYTFCNTYGSYLSYMLDTTKPLDSQQYSEDMTWADYFKDQAKTSITQVQMLCDAAEEAGFTLDEERSKAIDDTIDGLDDAAEEAGFSSVKKYLVAGYGKGMTVDIMRKCLTNYYLANAYYEEVYNGFSYSDEELETYYTENADNFDFIDYTYYLVSAEADDEGNVSEEAMAAAKETADTIVADVDSLETFEAHVAAIGDDATASTTTAQGSKLNSSISEWLLDPSRVEGDTTTIEVKDSGCYALYYSGRDNNHYNTVNVRHILVQAEANEDGEYTDEALEAAKSSAEEIYAEWQAGDATEESFAELANEHSDDTGSNTNGGLYENVYKNQMVEEFNNFCFAEGRKAGDTDIVYGSNSGYAGYHIIYFVGDGKLYSSYLAENDLRSKDVDSWSSENLKDYKFSTKSAYKFVG